MAYEGFPHICSMWHNHMWGDPHSTNSLSSCDCATYANMRETLICHMTPIYLIHMVARVRITKKQVRRIEPASLGLKPLLPTTPPKAGLSNYQNVTSESNDLFS